MKIIYDIYRKLNKQEVRHLKHQIKTASFNYEKVGKLFGLITRYEEQEEAFFSQKLYGNPPDNTFRVCKSRLKRLLENVLVNDKSLSTYSSPVSNMRFQSSKKLLQGHILLGRGAYLASKNLLLQVISNSKKFALYEEIYQAKLLLYRNQMVGTSVKEFEKQTTELLALNEERAMLDESNILKSFVSNFMANQTLRKEDLELARQKISRLKEILDFTQHPLANNNYLLCELYYHQINNRYDFASSFCKEYINLIEKEPALHNVFRQGNALVQLAHIELQLGKGKEARKHAQEAFHFLQKKGINHLQTLELAFRVEYYDNNLEKAMEWVEEALTHNQITVSKSVEAKWHYFKSCILFRQQEFKQAWLELNETGPLLLDKYGTNLYIRMLEIMILFEMEKLDLLETRILNMRQFIKRTQKKQTLKRPILLIKILMVWFRKQFDFKKTSLAIESEMKLLQAVHEHQPLLTSDFELIRLEQWMETGKS